MVCKLFITLVAIILLFPAVIALTILFASLYRWKSCCCATIWHCEQFKSLRSLCHHLISSNLYVSTEVTFGQCVVQLPINSLACPFLRISGKYTCENYHEKKFLYKVFFCTREKFYYETFIPIYLSHIHFHSSFSIPHYMMLQCTLKINWMKKYLNWMLHEKNA